MTNETQIPKAPPAPEVALRTLSSDAKSVAAGEVDPQPELVSPPVPGASTVKAKKEDATQTEDGQSPKKKGGLKKLILWALVIILILAIAGVVMFWLLPKLQSGGTTTIEVSVPTENEV